VVAEVLAIKTLDITVYPPRVARREMRTSDQGN
jgi:hypothetical protein